MEVTKEITAADRSLRLESIQSLQFKAGSSEGMCAYVDVGEHIICLVLMMLN